MADVWDHSPSEGGRLLVLLALADFASDRGVCWPRLRTLAKRSRLSERQVERVLKELVKDGEIEMPSGRRAENSPYRIRQNVGPTPMTGSTDTGDGLGPTPATGPYVEPSVEPSKEPPRPIDFVWAHYQAAIPGGDKKRLTARVERVIRAALEVREPPMLCQAISGLAASEHHRDGGWLAIEYAIGKVKKGESIEDRIDTMAAKAPLDAVVGGARVDPKRVQNRLEEVRSNHASGGSWEPSRSAKARTELEAWGYTFVFLDGPPWARLVRPPGKAA